MKLRNRIISFVVLALLLCSSSAWAALTTAQKATLKAAILADPTLSAYPNSSDGNFDLARYLSTTVSTPTFYVYRSNIPTAEVFDQIVWANLTPADAPDGTQAWANRSLACQGKQFNLQTILVGASTVNASKPNVRAGLQDALTNVPSGTGGALVSAGWVGLRDNTLARAATLIEKILATTTVQQDGSTPAKAATMGYEGNISAADVDAARNS